MKQLLGILVFFLAFSLLGNAVAAQVKNPVDWSYKAVKKGSNFEVVITATLKKPWHIYSQNTGKAGPIPTNITFGKNPLVTLVGKVKETGKLEKTFDKNFQTDVLSYANKVVFTQVVKVPAGVKTNITGTVEYMVCDDEQCLPPTKKSFDIKLQ